MLTDIDVYRCIVKDRLEKVKEETYGNSCYYKTDKNLKLLLTILNVFV
ncbi:hypothetical protein [Oceanobacillus luteolus]|uniref:Uncharacterized protein n=1 Tax=Oceanobacillus luteolus TaxID=1274358 RepID=A0ABW4HYJ9_9BACI